MNRWISGIYLSVHLIAASALIHGQEIHTEKYQNRPQSIFRLRVASASILPDKWKKDTNWKRIEHSVRRAALEGGAHLVITPEGVLEGYVVNEVIREKDPVNKSRMEKDFFELAEPLDGPYVEKAKTLADELDIFLVLGLLERNDRSLYNSAILVDPDGDIIGRYSKTHFAQGYTVNPPGYEPGSDFPVFDTPFGKLGILICYDRQLPEPARILALKGARVFIIPAYGGYSDRDGWNTVMMRTRAYENGIPLVFCNPYQSLLITASGEIAAMGNANEIVYYELNMSPASEKSPFLNRRPALYEPVIENQPDKTQ